MTTVPNLRRCNKCERFWHVDEFYPSTKSKDGLDTWCKTCHFAKKLRQRYALTPDAYYAILEAQGGVCAICKNPPGEKRLAVDHDHSCCPGEKTCGKCIRGILCDTCNWWLGLIDDDLAMLEKAEQYLRRYECTVSDAEVTYTLTRAQLTERALISLV